MLQDDIKMIQGPAFEQRRMCMTLHEEAKVAVQKPRCCTIRANDRLCWCDQAIVAPGSWDQDISGQTLINIQSCNAIYCILHENAKILQNNSAGICFGVVFKNKKHQKAAPIQLAILSYFYDIQNWFHHVLFSMYLLKRVSLCLEALLVCVLCVCVCPVHTCIDIRMHIL